MLNHALQTDGRTDFLDITNTVMYDTYDIQMKPSLMNACKKKPHANKRARKQSNTYANKNPRTSTDKENNRRDTTDAPSSTN